MRIVQTTILAAGLGLAAFHAGAQENMSAQQLIDADRAFNAMAQKEGTGKAFIAYAAEDPVLIRQGNMPIIGRAGFVEAFSQMAGSPLSWEPLRAEIAASQDLGYTFGRYTLRDGETVKAHGVYVTVWKKQPDGSWKFVLDGGGTTPQQVAKP
jgi:ketosteroid isomerase-like protein